MIRPTKTLIAAVLFAALAAQAQLLGGASDAVNGALDSQRTEASRADAADGGSEGRNSPPGTFDGPVRGTPDSQSTPTVQNSCNSTGTQCSRAPVRGIPESQQTPTAGN